MTLCRLIYASVRNGAVPLSVADLLAVSRKRNAENDVTGFLFFDGQRFAQVLEGPRRAVSDIYHSIARDARHGGIVLMMVQEIDTRLFGYWSMGLQEGLDDVMRGYLLETFALKGQDLSTLSGENMLQFLKRLATITRKLDEMTAMLAQKS